MTDRPWNSVVWGAISDTRSISIFVLLDPLVFCTNGMSTTRAHDTDVVAPTDSQTHAKEGPMFLKRFIPVSLFRPNGQTRPNLQAMDGIAGRGQTAVEAPRGRSPRARLHAELLFGR
jgi:hypothetical protein